MNSTFDKITLYDYKDKLLGSMRRSYLVKFVDPSKEYNVPYLAPHQSRSKQREDGFFTLKGSDLTEKQILTLFLNESL